MRTQRHQALISLSLGVLLIVPTGSIFGQEGESSQTTVDLRLAKTLEFRNADQFEETSMGVEPFQLARLDVAPSQSQGLAGGSLAGLQQDSDRLEQVNAQNTLSDSAKPKKGRFGRWVKKHWYVPVLAAAVIGVAVTDDGADGPGDEED